MEMTAVLPWRLAAAALPSDHPKLRGLMAVIRDELRLGFLKNDARPPLAPASSSCDETAPQSAQAVPLITAFREVEETTTKIEISKCEATLSEAIKQEDRRIHELRMSMEETDTKFRRAVEHLLLSSGDKETTLKRMSFVEKSLKADALLFSA